MWEARTPDPRHRRIMISTGLDPDRYLTRLEDATFLYIVDRETGEKITIDKDREMVCGLLRGGNNDDQCNV